MAGTMVIDGRRIEFENEKHLLEVIRKAGIELPTFCYHSELSVYGACRMCIVEDKWGNIMASCSEIPKDGMEIYTNTPKIQKHRKMILELLLSNHDRDCTTCEKNGKCKLQELAYKFGIRGYRFNQFNSRQEIDNSSKSIVRNPNKCIACGDCVRVCEEVQGVGVLGFAYRGSKLMVTPAFNKKLAEVDCVNCGQCTRVCPTGAMIIKDETDKVWKVLHDKKKRVVAQIAPAVRVAIGEEFGLEAGELSIGKIATALKRLGFDQVYDTALAADLTVMEESKEFFGRIESEKNLPIFTSCCPAWVRYAELKHPELLNNISSCKSPQQMFGTVIKEFFKKTDIAEERETVVISIMPCTAKKFEASRPENKTDGIHDVDTVITTQELAAMIREAGIVFNELEPESLDMPLGLSSGAGVMFGVTGGVTEAVIRRCLIEKTSESLREISFKGVRGMSGIKEASFEIDGRTYNFAMVHGLGNVENIIEMINSGEKNYDFIEVMACQGGCIGGAGQPIPKDYRAPNKRAKGIYNADSISQIKRSEENPMVIALYNGLLKGKHPLLHTKKEEYSEKA